MIQKKLCIPLLALLLLAGCSQDTQHIRLPNSDLYDHPPAEAPLIIEPFAPDVTVPDVDLRKVDLPFDRDETFTIGPRGDVFFAKEDGTVWNYTYGDGYACYDSSGTAENYTKPLHAFDLTPKRLELEEHYGVLIDTENTLWGWNIFSNDGTAPTRLMEDIADVCTTFHEVLALDRNGSLWVIPRSSSTPYLLMEGVRDLSCHVWPLALCDNGDLYSIQFKNVNGQISDIHPTRIMEEVFAIEKGSVYLSDGTLFTLEEDLKPVKRFVGAVQTAYCNDGLLILDALGRIWLQDGLTEPSLVAEHARQLIDHSQILYLDMDDNLCMIQNGSLVVLDRDVQKACAGYDLDSPETHTILYTKGDGILWRKGLTENSDHFDPLMEPERICNDLLSPFAEAEALSFEEPVFRLILSYAALPQHYRTMLESDAPFRDQLNSDTAEGFLQAIDTLQAFMDEQGLSVTRESLSHLTGLTIWNRGYNEGCVVELYVKDTRVSPFGILIPESLLYNIHSLEDLRYLPALERLELPPASIMSLAPLNELVHLKNCLSPASTH